MQKEGIDLLRRMTSYCLKEVVNVKLVKSCKNDFFYHVKRGNLVKIAVKSGEKDF